jgi:hypothetical protein
VVLFNNNAIRQCFDRALVSMVKYMSFFDEVGSMRVLNYYRQNPEGITQLRLGRIIVMEQKGKLDQKSDEEIGALLDPNNEEQAQHDEKLQIEIHTRQQEMH